MQRRVGIGGVDDMTTPSKVKMQYTEGDPEKGASSLRSDSGLIVGGGVSDFTGERSH